jgi:hypothetical protein
MSMSCRLFTQCTKRSTSPRTIIFSLGNQLENIPILASGEDVAEGYIIRSQQDVGHSEVELDPIN